MARQSNHTQVLNLKEADILMDRPAGTRGQNAGKDLEDIRKQKKEPFFGWPYSHLLRWGWSLRNGALARHCSHPASPCTPGLLLLIPTLSEDTRSGPPLLISLFPTSEMLRVMSSHKDRGSHCAPGEPPLQRSTRPPKALGLTDLPPLRLSHWLGSCLLEISGPPTPLSPLPHLLGSSPTPPPFWPCRTSLQSQIS